VILSIQTCRPRVCDWAAIRLPFDPPQGWAQGVLARRSLDTPDELTYYRVFAPEGTGVEELARVAGTRWAIEMGFERAKGEVGLDEYEVRRWEAWYRHITFSLLADAYLAVTRIDAVAEEKGAKAPT
jgi:SRSO17 transposase